ncbi:MAG: extracellular solute-binding protein, partial [Spirochaetaceae bacterium]|nr:extracellular solute-binding protein [Spirochaetaceae bacterium]
MRRSTVMFLVVLALFGVSCSPSEDSANNETEPRTITAFLDTIIQEWEGQEEFSRKYEELTGIRLVIIQPPHQLYNDKLLIQIASGDMPDICEVLPEYLPSLVNNGTAVPLEIFVSESDYAKDISVELLNSLKFPDGRLYGFPARDGGGCVTYIRKDWLDNLGLEVPRNWEQFEAVLRSFTFDDPDGNGKDDTYGYTDVNSASEDWYNRAVFLNARSEIYFDGRQWVDGFVQPSIIEALERLRSLYDQGLIDPDFLTNSTFSARTRFFNGQAGVITYWANHWARNLTERTRSTVGAHAEVVPIPAIQNARYIRRIGPQLVITTGSEDPLWIFENFIDRQYDRAKVQELFTYGVEGFHWSNSGSGPKFLTNENDPYEAAFTKAFVPPIAVLNDWNQPMPQDELAVQARNILRQDPVYDQLKAGGELYSRYYQEIERKIKPDV